MSTQDIAIIYKITKKRQKSFMKTKQRNLSKKEKEKQKTYGRNCYVNLFENQKNTKRVWKKLESKINFST